MQHRKVSALILCAGNGVRMRSSVSKVMHEIANLPLLGHVLEQLQNCQKTSPSLAITPFVVHGPHQHDIISYLSEKSLIPVLQTDARGTGDAVLSGEGVLSQHKQDVILVLYGDTPFISAKMIEELTLAINDKVKVAVAGFKSENPGQYGRLITEDETKLKAIIEAKDATCEQLKINHCNAGIMAIDANIAFSLLHQINNENKGGEYYLTDIVKIAVAGGHECRLILGDESMFLGVNSRAELARAENIWQEKKRTEIMNNGVTLRHPDSVFFSHDTDIGQDCLIEGNVFFGKGVKIADNVTIKAFSHIEGATIASGANIGPFARLRPGCDIGEGAKIGNFVEGKNITMQAYAKASHLTYLGDCDIGEGANIGAGTITCNYDGVKKSRTIIGKGAFIGSNTSLIAPVKIGECATIAASSAIAKNVEDGALAITRTPQKNIKNWQKK